MNDRHHTPRRLKRGLSLQISLMLGGTLLIAAGAVWGINGLHGDYGVALRGSRQLRDVYEIGVHVSAAREAIDAERPDPDKALSHVRAAATKLDLFTSPQNPAAGWLESSDDDAKHLRAVLHDSLAQLTRPAPQPSHDSIHAQQLAVLTQATGLLSDLSARINGEILTTQAAAEHRRHATLTIVSILSLLVMGAAAVNGILLYRRVMRPLASLKEAARGLAGRRFQQRVGPMQDREFQSLADEFNAMALELDTVYAELERRVREQSRALVRSERLASVGYLAAGVAHEINNPLGIIAGYGERSLVRLRSGSLDGSTLGGVRGDVEVICEEAFRCKRITDRLLSLARSTGEARSIVRIQNLAEQVVATVGGLRRFADRRIVLSCESNAELDVFGRDDEIKQVLLNLVLNALDAVEPQHGLVRVEVRRAGAAVELIVTDNGRGMTPETLERVFEPFYSERRGEPRDDDRPGTGLGLSITHAIVSDHGGTIAAHSDGPGLGSRFTVQLPVATKEEAKRHVGV